MVICQTRKHVAKLFTSMATSTKF